MATPDVQSQIDDATSRLEQIRSLQKQIASYPPPTFATINPNAGRAFRAEQQRRIAVLDKQASDVTREIQRVQRPNPNTPKPMTEAQRESAIARQDKQLEDISAQKPQKELAQSREAQQKEAADESKVALGAGGKSLQDLLATGTQKYDPATGQVTFQIPNTSGKRTPAQTTALQQLTKAAPNAGGTPEELFGAGVAAPQFDKNGVSVNTPNGNPFVGNQQQYNALAKLYQDSQPTVSTDLAVPKGVFEKSYLSTVPAYGSSFPENPIYQADRQAAEAKRADAFSGDAPGAIASEDALAPARAFSSSLATPITPDMGLGMKPVVSGTQPTDVTLPAPISPLGPDPAAVGAARIAASGAPTGRALEILNTAKQQGIPANDPVVAEALAQEGAQASVDKIPGQAKTVLTSIGDLSPAGVAQGIGGYIGRTAKDLPGVLADVNDQAEQDYQQQMALKAAAEKLRGGTGEPVQPSADPDFVPQ